MLKYTPHSISYTCRLKTAHFTMLFLWLVASVVTIMTTAKGQVEAPPKRGQSNALLLESRDQVLKEKLISPLVDNKQNTAAVNSKRTMLAREKETEASPSKARPAKSQTKEKGIDTMRDISHWAKKNAPRHIFVSQKSKTRSFTLQTEEKEVKTMNDIYHKDTKIAVRHPTCVPQKSLDKMHVDTTRHPSQPSSTEPNWERLQYSKHYNRIRVTNTSSSTRVYLPPPDYSRCGPCLCFQPENHQNMVYADCKRYKNKPVTVLTLPEYLPPNTYHIELDNNPIRHFEANVLAKYISLLTVKAPYNRIKTLHAADCRLPLNVHVLDLSFNFILKIENNAFSCMYNLTQLILQRNHITEIRNGTLAGLGKLEVLNLAYNNIQVIHSGAFLSSSGLITLDLTVNQFVSLSHKNAIIFRPLSSLRQLYVQGTMSLGQYPTDTLLALPALRELAVNGEKLPFDEKLSALKNLTKLSLGTIHYCWTKNFSKSYFKGLVHLVSLKIRGCSAKVYSPQMFDENPRLIDFAISSLASGDISAVFPILCYLPNLENVRSVKIVRTKKHIKFDPLRVLSPEDAECLSKMKNLNYLSLEHNALSQVGREFVIRLPQSLQKLNLQGNLLISFQSMAYMIHNIPTILPKLQYLFEDYQGEGQSFDQDVITSDKMRDSIDEEWRADFDTLDYPTESTYDLNSVEAQRDLLAARQGFSQTIGSTQQVSINSPRSHYLDMYSATNVFNFGIWLFSQRPKVKSGIFNLSSTLITNWGVYPIQHMPKDTLIADLSNNRCEQLTNSFFLRNNSLTELYARGNFLGPQLSKDHNGSSLLKLTNLEILDLSINHLFHLPWHVFKGLSNLRILKLSSNNIETFDVHIGHMKSLLFVDLSKNSISSISQRTREQLDHLSRNGKVSIDLTYNPLPCTCEGFEFLTWLSLTPVRVLNKDFLLCQDNVHLVGDLSKRVIELQQQCTSKKFLIMAISFSSAFFLLIVGFVWVFQNRWWIKYTWNHAVSHIYGYKTLNKTRNRDSDPEYKFDAFFVYSPSSCDFVLDDCLEQLETNRGHSLCVEDRDFLAGSYVPCNITCAVRNSKTTVVVLDESFRAVGWTQYAVEMAQVEAVRSKRNVLHLLILGSPPEGHLPGVYLKIFRQGHFSEIPPKDCPTDMREKFWDSFSQTLGHTVRQGNRPSPGLLLCD